MKKPMMMAALLLLSACHGMDPHPRDKDSAYPAHGMKSWRCSPGTRTKGCTHPAMHPYGAPHDIDQHYRDADTYHEHPAYGQPAPRY